MSVSKIIACRLHHQQISKHKFQHAADVVSWLGAMQAQDYSGSKWSIALRLPNTTDNDIERAIAERTIVRTWAMRGTLHFVAARDVHWMLKLLTPRIIKGRAGRYRQLELEKRDFVQSAKVITHALKEGKQLTRKELFSLLDLNGISTADQRGIHILNRLAMEGLICFAPPQGKQPAFTLLEEWIPSGKILSHDEALAELTLRYFNSHGPATLLDFAWWSGLKISDARKGIDSIKSKLIYTEVKDIIYWMGAESSPARGMTASVHLLPGFDEYMLGYKDRSVALDPTHAQKVVPRNNGMSLPTIVIKGRIAGTWKRTFKKDSVFIELFPFNPLSKAMLCKIETAAKRYAKYAEISLAGFS